MNYLISGVPCCLKTVFGNWLQEHGWLHIDMEAWDSSPEHRLWNECIQKSSIGAFITIMADKAPNIVYTWGFPPCNFCISLVQQFKSNGVNVWWFNGDVQAARNAYIGRATADVKLFDIQMEKIHSHQSQLDALYGENKIRTLDAHGNYLAFEDIAKGIHLHL